MRVYGRIAGLTATSVLPPFGLMSEVADLAVTAARKATIGRGWAIQKTVLVLAAHGSGRSRAPAAAATAIRDHIAAALPFAEIRLGFIEEEPSLREAAREAGAQALCLPLFVARWGHVVSDVPRDLAAAGFAGPSLAPLGARPEVPAILARAFSTKA